MKPWIGPYVLVGKLYYVRYELKSKVRNGVARVAAIRLRRFAGKVAKNGVLVNVVGSRSSNVLQKLIKVRK